MLTTKLKTLFAAAMRGMINTAAVSDMESFSRIIQQVLLAEDVIEHKTVRFLAKQMIHALYGDHFWAQWAPYHRALYGELLPRPIGLLVIKMQYQSTMLVLRALKLAAMATKPSTVRGKNQKAFAEAFAKELRAFARRGTRNAERIADGWQPLRSVK